MSEQSPYDASTGGLPRLAKPAADTRKLRQELSYAQARLIEVAADRDRLAAELKLERTARRIECEMSEACCQCQDLRAQLSAARADAERYRWLRDHMHAQALTTVYSLPLCFGVDYKGSEGNMMDEAIDAARTAPSAGSAHE